MKAKNGDGDGDGVFDLERLWDVRLRRFYGVRFDVREGVVDWDWNMKVKDKVTKKRYFLFFFRLTQNFGCCF